jgi:DNA primase catalytic core
LEEWESRVAFSDDDISKVRESNNLVEVVSEVVALKRRGQLFWARCPFHQEKTPSFKVDSTSGLYYCFGCAEGGDVIRFIQKTKSLTFVEAVEYLAARAGIVLSESRSSKRDGSARRRIQDAVAAAADFYHRYLVESPEAQKARDYLEKRGIGREAIAKFRLGYSPDAWDGLCRDLHRKGFAEQTLVDAGLAVRGDTGRLRDFFRARVIFPICDAAGRPIAFGGRTLPDAPPEAGPKYRNSPNTRLYNKSQALYALHLARREISSTGSVVVVEGYTDVIALHEIGVTNSVATCGTAFGSDHVEILRRHGLTSASPLGSLRVVLAFDSDTAGEVAGGRAFDQVLGAGAAEVLDVRIALLPSGKDPADLAAEDAEALRAALDEASPALGYLIERALSSARLDSPEAKIGAARVGVKQALRHPDPMVQQQYLQRVAELCRLDSKTVRQIWLDLGGGRVAGGGRQAGPGWQVGGGLQVGGGRQAGSAWQAGAGRQAGSGSRVGRGAASKPALAASNPEHAASGRSTTSGRAPASGRSTASGRAPASGQEGSVADGTTTAGMAAVPPLDIDKIRLHIFGSPEVVDEFDSFDPAIVIESDVARRVLDALERARRDVASALRYLESDRDAREALAKAAADDFELSGEDLKRWEVSVLEDARRRVLERQAIEAKNEGDLQTYQRIKRELKGVGARR